MFKKLFFALVVVISVMITVRYVKKYRFDYGPVVNGRYNSIGVTPQSFCLLSCIEYEQPGALRDRCLKKCDTIVYAEGAKICANLKAYCFDVRKLSPAICDPEYADCMRGARVLPDAISKDNKKYYRFF